MEKTTRSNPDKREKQRAQQKWLVPKGDHVTKGTGDPNEAESPQKAEQTLKEKKATPAEEEQKPERRKPPTKDKEEEIQRESMQP